LALHPSGLVLYVLNAVSEHKGLPCGTVEAYRVQTKTGHLTFLNRQPLALSATMPRNIAISPDGKTLAVAVHGGGAYNLLPIMPDGGVGRVGSAMKETGCGPVAGHQDTAHPQAVLFDRSGDRMIAADLGCDRISVLSRAASGGALGRHSRCELPPGSGPRHLVLSPSGDRLYVDHALDGSASGFHYDAATGSIGEQLMSLRGGFGDALAIHPQGNFLYSADKDHLTVWRTGRKASDFESTQSIDIRAEAVREIVPLEDGSAVLTLASKGVVRRDAAPISGRLGSPVLVAEVAEPCSLTMQRHSFAAAASYFAAKG
jgi:6-phosphogluconolactonase (cycloisomerase 2 family)